MQACCSLLFSGVLERFPGTKLVLAESNIGWIPNLLEHADDMFFHYRWFNGAAMQMHELPSELFHRNVWATFIIDSVGLELRYRMNHGHLMWSTDYPHTPCDWPNSRVTVLNQFRGLPLDEVRGFIHGNACELYGLQVPDKRPARRGSPGCGGAELREPGARGRHVRQGLVHRTRRRAALPWLLLDRHLRARVASEWGRLQSSSPPAPGL
jgi:hypothetical protein